MVSCESGERKAQSAVSDERQLLRREVSSARLPIKRCAVVVVDCRFNYPAELAAAAAAVAAAEAAYIFTRLATAAATARQRSENRNWPLGFSLNWSFRLGVDANDERRVAISGQHQRVRRRYRRQR